MIILFIGPQGSGKGTQAKIISKKSGIIHISTGELLRETKGELEKEVDSYINQGKLVPDELILKLLKERIKKPDCEKGIILEGYPRNLNQSKKLVGITKIDNVIEISISDQEAIKRLKGRWNCKKCGIGYNIITVPKPKQSGICDECGSALYQREDDKDEASIQKRLGIYHKDTEPILEHYLEHYPSIKINGKQSIEKVTEDIMKSLDKI